MARAAVGAVVVWLGIQAGMVSACVYNYTGAGMDGPDWQLETSGATGYWAAVYGTSRGANWQRISYIHSADGAGYQTRGAFVWTAPPGERIVRIDFNWSSNTNPDCWAQVVYRMEPAEVLSGTTAVAWLQPAVGWLSGPGTVSFAPEDNVQKIGLGFDCPKWGYVDFFAQFSNVVITTSPDRVPVEGTVVLDGFVGDNDTVGVKLEFTPVDGGAAAGGKMFLTSAGGFAVDSVLQGTYLLTVTAPNYLKKTVSVTIWDNPTVLDPIVLKGADANGDDCVSFEDFSLLQNNYGQSGDAGANPLATVAATGGCGSLGILFLGLSLAALRLGLRNE